MPIRELLQTLFMARHCAMALLTVCFLGSVFAAPKNSASTASCRSHEIYKKAVHAYDQGVSELAKQESQRALIFLDQGLATLGWAYVNEQWVDETGAKLVLAESEEQRGAIEIAANIKSRVLESRLAAFRAKNQCR